MTELDRPSWRRLLENVVDVEIDYATRHKLPGFLSESYTGEGVAVHRQRRHPRDHRLPPAPDHRRRLALHPGRGLHGRPGQGRAVPGGELAGRVHAAHRPRARGRGSTVTRQEVDPVPDDGPHAVADPRPARDGVGPHEDLPRLQGPRREARGGLPARRRCRPALRRRPGSSPGTTRTSPTRSTREQDGFHVRTEQARKAGIAFVPAGTRGSEPVGRPAQPPLSHVHAAGAGRSSPSSRWAARPAVERLIPTEIFTRFAATAGAGRRDPDPSAGHARAWRGSRKSSSRSGRNRKGGRSTSRSRTSSSRRSHRSGTEASRTSNLSSSPPTLLVPTKTWNSPGSTTNWSSRS